MTPARAVSAPAGILRAICASCRPTGCVEPRRVRSPAMAPTSAPSTPQSSIDAIAPHPVLSSVVGAAPAVEVLADSVWLWAAGEPLEGAAVGAEFDGVEGGVV